MQLRAQKNADDVSVCSMGKAHLIVSKSVCVGANFQEELYSSNTAFL